MNKDDTYITLDRKILKWRWWKDIKTAHLWTTILILANGKEKEWLDITVPRGTFATSYQQLADASGLSIKEVRTCIKKLIKTGEISQKATNKYQLITVEKYEDYQNKKQNGANKGQARGKQGAIKGQQLKKDKESKRKINKDILSSTLDETAIRIVDYLNMKAGKNYRADTKNTRKLISARLKDYAEEDFYKVIDNQVAKWKDDERMADFIRPQTLFAESNFESYLNAPPPKSERERKRIEDNIAVAKANIDEIMTRIEYVKKQISSTDDVEQRIQLRSKVAIYEQQLQANQEYIKNHERS